ncbi:MAG TPA: TnsD family Tn7-like transposition protein [Pyrinomonadaceae bacterium]
MPEHLFSSNTLLGHYPKSKIIDNRKLRKFHRAEWIKIKKQNSGMGRHKLSLLNQKSYYWLKINDREWLEKNSPARQFTREKPNRINWADRDNELSVKADNLAKEFFLSSDYPVKVTITGIAKRLKIAYLVVKRPDCIPRTIKVLQKNAESTEEFIARRILYVTDCLIKEKRTPPLWLVLNRAKVSNPKLVKLPKVQEALLISKKKFEIAESSGWKNKKDC